MGFQYIYQDLIFLIKQAKQKEKANFLTGAVRVMASMLVISFKLEAVRANDLLVKNLLDFFDLPDTQRGRNMPSDLMV